MAQVIEVDQSDLSVPKTGSQARRKVSAYDAQLEALNKSGEAFAILTDADSTSRTDNRVQSVIVRRAAKALGVPIDVAIRQRQSDKRFVLVVSKASPNGTAAVASQEPAEAAEQPEAAQEPAQAGNGRGRRS